MRSDERGKMHDDHDYRVPHERQKIPFRLVKKIRELYAKGNTSTYRIAKLVGVSQFTIWRIVNYKRRVIDKSGESLNQQFKRAERKRGKRTWSRMQRTKMADDKRRQD